jgi:hypothetical protein
MDLIVRARRSRPSTNCGRPTPGWLPRCRRLDSVALLFSCASSRDAVSSCSPASRT